MSKRSYIFRYSLLIKKLQSKPYSTYGELQSYIDHQLSYLQMNDESLHMGFSKRTLQRDIREIRSIFGIDIEYSTSSRGYFICESETENMNSQRMMEAFDIFNSLNIAQDIAPFIHLEKRKPQGTENLYGLLHAIKNRLSIQFAYYKFWEEEVTTRKADPYALKECRNRWYLLAKEGKDGHIKTFALDRISGLDISKERFRLPVDFNMDETFRYCFGIISNEQGTPKEIVLSFTHFQGKYIKTLPLHDSQQILVDDEKELRIQLKLYPTHDLVMEILSFGENVKVLKPAALAKEIKTAHQHAYEKY